MDEGLSHKNNSVSEQTFKTRIVGDASPPHRVIKSAATSAISGLPFFNLLALTMSTADCTAVNSPSPNAREIANTTLNRAGSVVSSASRADSVVPQCTCVRHTSRAASFATEASRSSVIGRDHIRFIASAYSLSADSLRTLRYQLNAPSSPETHSTRYFASSVPFRHRCYS